MPGIVAIEFSSVEHLLRAGWVVNCKASLYLLIVSSSRFSPSLELPENHSKINLHLNLATDKQRNLKFNSMIV